MSGFSTFFGLFVFALLIEWARIEVWQANREESGRQDKVALRASDDGVIASLLLDRSPGRPTLRSEEIRCVKPTNRTPRPQAALESK
jgi:hypothetical protein